ncbi:hypothetical protein SZN_22801, partial [Streptomyces zinciresistens K42]
MIEEPRVHAGSFGGGRAQWAEHAGTAPGGYATAPAPGYGEQYGQERHESAGHGPGAYGSPRGDLHGDLRQDAPEEPPEPAEPAAAAPAGPG